MSLPPLPERLQAHRDQMEQVHECQTPGLSVYRNRRWRRTFLSGHSAGVAHCSRLRLDLGGRVCGRYSAEEVLATPDDVYVLLRSAGSHYTAARYVAACTAWVI